MDTRCLGKTNKQTFPDKVVKPKIPLLHVPVSRYLFSIVSGNRCGRRLQKMYFLLLSLPPANEVAGR